MRRTNGQARQACGARPGAAGAGAHPPAEVLWCCEGKDMGAVERFARYVGKRWLDGLEAVAMDMNASYDSAFRALC
ncbi:MAG: transposase, partial [Sphaerochaetaceae bacterium]|nr:transposase [Spirochaetales bacterium]MDY5499415.1 transposase [Sphaerochaetaceae bacterium]